ncbi:MAG: hypothetical protein J5I93_25105 [Pirellulaceae bacterium]|nr:hypothetical protein [Pirellulaceae bacterium]
MSNRKHIPIETETKILMESARRCALCFGLKGDLSRKAGQIAHIDRDASNADEANLVYLCLEDHDEYDSKTSQSKGITAAELTEYKKRLNAAIADGEHAVQQASASNDDARAAAILGHDKRIFQTSDQILGESSLIEFLDQLQTDDSYIITDARRLDRFRRMFTETGNQYINQELATSLSSLLSALDAILRFTALNFFVYPRQQSAEEPRRFCMYPELNCDRDGSGTPEDMNRYAKFQLQLDELANNTREAYERYRMDVKNVLVQ